MVSSSFIRTLCKIQVTIRLKSIFISIEERAMFATYTAKYTKITTGYMGQLVEWEKDRGTPRKTGGRP